jgi:uncharacterized repeat protein (TIGR01451 family)
MKLLSILSLTAALLSAPVMTEVPVLRAMQTSGQVLAQGVQTKPQVQLTLVAEKKVLKKDAQGKDTITWQAMGNQAAVQPGDIIRYTVNGKNVGDRSAKNLVITQPIPNKTIYVINSASLSSGSGTITYSIDNGKTYAAKPTIQVKLPDGKIETRPAPAERYTHIRWSLNQSIEPQQPMSAAYQVKVK